MTGNTWVPPVFDPWDGGLMAPFKRWRVRLACLIWGHRPTTDCSVPAAVVTRDGDLIWGHRPTTDCEGQHTTRCERCQRVKRQYVAAIIEDAA